MRPGETPTSSSRRTPTFHRIGHIARSRARWIAITAVVLVLAGPHLLALAGNRLIAVDGGSMAPTYLPGDILITSSPTGDDLRVGQILVVGTPPDLYTHRVVETRDRGATVTARLQGDANTVRDLDWIEQTDVYAVPAVRLTGPAADALGAVSNPIGRGALVAGAAALLWWPCSSKRTRNRSTPR